MSKLKSSLRTPQRIAGTVEAIENGTRELIGTLDYLVEEIEQKNGELAALRSRPLTRSSMESVVHGCISDLEPVGVVNASLLEHGRSDAVQSQLRNLNAAQLLALVAPQLLRDALMRQLDYRAEDAGGWPSEEQREAEIERERDLELEVAELEEALQAARKAAWRAGLTSIPGHEKPQRDPPPGPSISGPGARL
jgi:hypothetical protein